MANAARFWSMRPEKQSFKSAKSPDLIGIAAHP
jgi:glutaredoxin-related protein